MDNSNAIEGTSLLGSVWNLFRDVKDLASKEIDRLLEHFPYNNTTRVIITTNQDQLLSAKKRQDVRTQVNDVSTRRIPAATPSVMSGVSTESRRMLSVRSSSASTISETGSRQSTTRRKQPLATPRPTPTPPLLKRDSSISTALYRSSQDTEADWSSAVSHLDELESESESSHFRTSVGSRESSVTPPITSMAQAMSISGRSQSSQRSQRGEQPSESGFTNDAPGHQQQQPQKRRNDGPETSLYPKSSITSRSRTPTENETHTKAVETPPSAFTDSKNNPFIAPSGHTSPVQESRTPSPTSIVDKATLSALIEELASLMAEKQSQYRTHSAPMSVSSGAPPPPPPLPPPFPETPLSKMRTPPVNEATRSMQRVLNELSTSKVQLRKTGSPFLSRISSAIDSSPNAKFSRVVFRSRMDMMSDKYSGSSSNTGSTAPLSLVSHLRGPSHGANLPDLTSQSLEKIPAETPMKRQIQPIYQEPEEEQEEELSWPSPATVKRADSRLEMAVKDLSRSKHGGEQAVVMPRNNDGFTVRKLDIQADGKEERLGLTTPTPRLQQHLVESKRKWTPRTSQPTETVIREVAQTTSSISSGTGDLTLGAGSAIDGDVFGRERFGPRLNDGNGRPRRPSRPRSMVLSRSMTDPTTLHSSNSAMAATPTMTIAEKEKERQWFLESDMDGWKVAQ
ncbi:hypothetical protein BGZ97_007887 [Linnemannia gamsii]|uniref:Uncharacterized protein n=1 Tax=Linnemannia gamsii TaxID=64522 RepID=A0A9P6UDV5_9FUNG|nr:hypothetical protein BGZ97_007887 [Linnemannia gamsii]